MNSQATTCTHPFTPSFFFDLTSFEHAKLFSGAQAVWEVLPNIDAYLRSLTLGVHKGTISPDAYLIHPELITIEQGASIEAGAYIQGPAWIGSGTQVRHGAYIRGGVLTGKNCVVGHTTEVKNALFLDGAKAGHFAYIGDSILGNEVNLGAGTKLANLRLDNQPVVIKVETTALPTTLRKLGAILGDRAQTGCNAVLNPGTLFEKEAVCFPCEVAKGYRKRRGNKT